MGPGIWFDKSDDQRLVHIRLSHTHNQIDGWPDYTDGTDPRQLKLALSDNTTHALFLRDCRHIRFKNLTVRFGGQDTIRLRKCCDIGFDHIQIQAGSRAIRLQGDPGEKNRFILFKNCEVDGGTPTWFFRSDRKDGYFFGPDDANAPQEEIHENRLGSATTGVLVSSGQGASCVTIHHCEIFNGHDVYVFGDHMSFHDNWVNNINDDALNMGAEEAGTDNARIYRNVITQCLTALSFAARDPVGYVQIFRNLIDIRKPTLGIRPEHKHAQKSLRQGQFYKDGGDEGPFDLWHNTCLTLNAGGVGADPDFQEFNDAGFTHYHSLGTSARRRAFNNIFVAVYPMAGKTKPIAFLPPSSFDGPTDGNTYERINPGAEPDAEVHRFKAGDANTPYVDLDAYQATNQPYEANGRREDPKFRAFDLQGLPLPNDDLRLQTDSPARNSAVALPLILRCAEIRAGGILSLLSHDRGCYRFSWNRMKVGVDSRKKFPAG